MKLSHISIQRPVLATVLSLTIVLFGVIAFTHLANDPVEENDVAGEFPKIVKSIESIMNEEHEEASLDRFKMPQLGDSLIK